MPDLFGTARDKRSERIRTLNDSFRSTFVGGRVMMTAAVAALPSEVKAQALLAVQTFNSFDKCNDPHGEHDFGAFELAGVAFFWKLDYYNNEMTGGADDPSVAEQTTRVLTLMRSTDY